MHERLPNPEGDGVETETLQEGAERNEVLKLRRTRNTIWHGCTQPLPARKIRGKSEYFVAKSIDTHVQIDEEAEKVGGDLGPSKDSCWKCLQEKSELV